MEEIDKSQIKKKKKKFEVKLGSQVAKRCWSSRRLEDICWSSRRVEDVFNTSSA